jgi:Cu/Ag efflux pump CusA
MIPLSQLATIVTEDGPAQISRENIHRRIAIEANVRGRDLGGFVANVQKAVETQVKLPTGYYVEYGGQFENLQRASARLLLVVPVALFLIFVLLYTTFNTVKPALLIYFNIPIAATGGVVALFVRGMPFSISAGVGFIALFGVAVMNGLVLTAHIRRAPTHRFELVRRDRPRVPGKNARHADGAARRRPWFSADGSVDGRRGGSAAAVGDGGHRRSDHVHDVDAARAADALSMV